MGPRIWTSPSSIAHRFVNVFSTPPTSCSITRACIACTSTGPSRRPASRYDTLRDAFGSTDELIRTYLRARHTRLQDAVARELPRYNTPRERLVGVFEIQGQSFVEPGFHGCALVTASAEALPGEVVEEIVTEYRDWLQNLFFDLAFAAEVPHPEELAEQLVVLFDGAGISAWLDRRPSTVNTSRAIAEALIDAALQS